MKIIFFFLVFIAGLNTEILIKNGLIVDGTGGLPFKSDILINNDKIIKIGRIEIESKSINKIINAEGLIVSPGFIDSHSHGDPLKDSFLNFLHQGVTTISINFLNFKV
jgi:N-acyl-D-amino-acid deacylase